MSAFLILFPITTNKLDIKFHEIEFPLIFHTDNGNEFIAETVFRLLKQSPFTYCVRGRVRTPSNQGSVERGNKDIKKAIAKTINDALVTEGKTLTWVQVIGLVTSAMNNSVSYGNAKLTPYKHVFGMDFKCPFDIPHEHMSQINDIQELCNYLNDNNLVEWAQAMGYNVTKAIDQKHGIGTQPLHAPTHQVKERQKHVISKCVESCTPQDSVFQPHKLICETCLDNCSDQFHSLELGIPTSYNECLVYNQYWDQAVVELFAIRQSDESRGTDYGGNGN